MSQIIRASAPASVGNVGVGYDILGLAFGALKDRVGAERTDQSGVRLGKVSGVVTDLPSEVMANTALRAADSVLRAARADFGATIRIEKGIPASAGLGGSAASAVAGAAAANALLADPFSLEDLFEHALEGERASSDPPPPDNVAAALMGGLVLMRPGAAPEIVPLPAPGDLVCVVVHPDTKMDTRAARAALSENVPLSIAVEHAGDLARFLVGCVQNDRALIAQGLKDVLVEPQRAHLIPGFEAVKAAALGAGALGASLSGSGPSIFAWCEAEDASAISQAMQSAFEDEGLASRAYQSRLDTPGVKVEAP